MLVLTRKVHETIQIGDDIKITVVRIVAGKNKKVRIGIDAPPALAIVRDDAIIKNRRE